MEGGGGISFHCTCICCYDYAFHSILLSLLRGIHILADAPVIVYGINPQRFSSDGFIAIPNHLLGNEYYAIGMPAEDKQSQLGVVAVEEGDSTVTVTLPNDSQLLVSLISGSLLLTDSRYSEMNNMVAHLAGTIQWHRIPRQRQDYSHSETV